MLHCVSVGVVGRTHRCSRMELGGVVPAVMGRTRSHRWGFVPAVRCWMRCWGQQWACLSPVAVLLHGAGLSPGRREAFRVPLLGCPFFAMGAHPCPSCTPSLGTAK